MKNNYLDNMIETHNNNLTLDLCQLLCAVVSEVVRSYNRTITTKNLTVVEREQFNITGIGIDYYIICTIS